MSELFCSALKTDAFVVRPLHRKSQKGWAKNTGVLSSFSIKRRLKSALIIMLSQKNVSLIFNAKHHKPTGNKPFTCLNKKLY